MRAGYRHITRCASQLQIIPTLDPILPFWIGVIQTGRRHLVQWVCCFVSQAASTFNTCLCRALRVVTPWYHVVVMTAHQGRSADPRLIQNSHRKEMTQTPFTNQCQKLTQDSQSQPSSSVFSFHFFKSGLLASASLCVLPQVIIFPVFLLFNPSNIFLDFSMNLLVET